ncbi:Single-stranded-DNA-specific exonuclease RecJ [hydrothermal vent metagenome]|uniref:Single-stranded-DNA-specific exonuclease RecJ n=1 Tax=hydrothermal vent metagenome TaxID=652676 RepID=A0A3B0Z0I6_9ZZZZ
MKKNIVKREVADIAGFALDMPSVLRRIYASRGIKEQGELDYSLKKLTPFHSLLGIDAAVDLLVEALVEHQKIVVVADFDVDGATSCVVFIKTLRALGASVDYLVPNRFEYGYGLTPEIVEVALIEKKPNLIVTVDNGIASIEGVAVARKNGVKVLITDHHLPGKVLPDADAIVNPNQHGDQFPSKNLAGVGVVFYVMLALRARLREMNWFNTSGIADINMAQVLDLVALGTVADVVPLDHINRILVAQGLARIRSGKACVGIKALIDVAERTADTMVSSDMGFALGPRLNAAGRLDDMSLGIECLLTDEPKIARARAQDLNQLNQDRRLIEAGMKEQAITHIAAWEKDQNVDELPSGLCLYEEDWHQGVLGIVASRIKDIVHRPVIAFAPADGNTLKGSARSISGVHIRDVLETIATNEPQLLSKFGGHAMAAGLTIQKDDLTQFKLLFDQEVSRQAAADSFINVIYSDGELEAQDIGMKLAEQLRNEGPWGQGFPEPVFDGRFQIAGTRVVGGKHLKLQLKQEGAEKLVEAIAFNQELDAELQASGVAHFVYRLDVNEFRGRKTTQLIVQHIVAC